jgi:hypothetical protein
LNLIDESSLYYFTFVCKNKIFYYTKVILKSNKNILLYKSNSEKLKYSKVSAILLGTGWLPLGPPWMFYLGQPGGEIYFILLMLPLPMTILDQKCTPTVFLTLNKNRVKSRGDMTSFLTPILVGPFFQVSFTCRSGSGGRCTMARPRG